MNQNFWFLVGCYSNLPKIENIWWTFDVNEKSSDGNDKNRAVEMLKNWKLAKTLLAHSS